MIDFNAKVSRYIACLVFAVPFFAASVSFVLNEYALATLQRGASDYQLALFASTSDQRSLNAPEPATLVRSLGAQPLSPMVVNAAIFRDAYQARNPAVALPKVELLKKLGWRYTLALQNRAYAAVQRQDLREISDISDALLRRGVILEEATALMNLMELNPSTRKVVVAKLAKYPDWRPSYLERVYKMQDLRQIKARGKVVSDLFQMGAGLDRSEIYPTLKIMIASGQTKTAYDLWLQHSNMKALPLNDPHFLSAWRMHSDPLADMPFEWNLSNGAGNWAEVVLKKDENNGKPVLRLNWDRSGAPLLLSQQTVMVNQINRLVISGRQLSEGLLKNFRFSLDCPTGSQVFRNVIRVTKTRIELAPNDPLPCETPVFSISGNPEAGTVSSSRSPFGSADPLQLELRYIQLLPASSSLRPAG